ncbi:MAG: molybdenum cofactor guanylyltransferase [Cytophagaceae bacterium]|jgi:molybdopterin-guanine dinucleotide biosynthesis protein A|nr:molybdenum cofactor guanylyltransferase [Cytophagaceae bacterium]
MDHTLGVILAGGFSSRMGQDKALLIHSFYKISWLEKQYNLLSTFFPQVVVSKRKEQNYFNILPSAMYLSDTAAVEGPLRGILTVHQKFPKMHLFVAAVDLPGLNPLIISKIMNQFRKNPEADAVVFKDQYFEPLCGVYKSDFLARLCKQFQNLQETEENKTFSLQYILENANTLSLPISEEDLQALRNINSPDQL